VNESPTYEFHFERGLQQGDPLSLFLFPLRAEGLNVLVENDYLLVMVWGRNLLTKYLIFNLWTIPYWLGLKVGRMLEL